MAKGDRILWGIVSSRALRAHWALIELELDYRTEPIQSRTGQTQGDAYTALNPRQKIPVLQDGDLTMSESAAIVAYLAERYGRPGHRLIPEWVKDDRLGCGVVSPTHQPMASDGDPFRISLMTFDNIYYF